MQNPTELGLDEAMHLAELQAGEVYLSDDISPFAARDLIRDIGYARNFVGDGKGIHLFINSIGGEIHSSFAIYDYIRRIRQKTNVAAIVQGQAASAAAMIVLQACSPRIATANSRFLLHEPSLWGRGPEKASIVADDAEELNRLHGVLVNILAERSRYTVPEILGQLSRRDVWMSADEALDWGLIDEIWDQHG